VLPREVPSRGLGTVEGRAALLHAVAHIEFNAINLALDAAYRFRGMPREFYLDWTGVAADEARHFRLLRARLARWVSLRRFSRRTTACGRWRARARIPAWRGWRWCRGCWRRAASMSRRA
jgi:hypothetical protein